MLRLFNIYFLTLSVDKGMRRCYVDFVENIYYLFCFLIKGGIMDTEKYKILIKTIQTGSLSVAA